MRVLCLGGNVALGVRSPRGWPELMWELSGAHVVNGAIRGARIVDVVRSIPTQPAGGRGWDWVVIQAGVYDARGGGTPPAEFMAMMQQAIASVRDRWPDAQIAVCSITNVFPHCKVRGFNRAARRWVSRVQPLVLALEDVEVVDMTDHPASLFPDGLHPSGVGSRQIAFRVMASLGLRQQPRIVEER